jgi:hypothetical protein
VFEDVMSFDDESGQTVRASTDQHAALMELSISTGRYGVMLGQAREILRLPEPAAPAGDSVDGSVSDHAKERARIAREQAKVAAEFLEDTQRACQRRKTPRKVRQAACEQQKRMPAELKTAVPAELNALAHRNDQMSEYVIEWWDTVCATAPKPRDGEPSACAIE